MRTEENFKHTYEEAKWFTKFHNKSVWIVPKENDYAISIIEPTPKELPVGTSAVNMEYDSESMVWLYATKSIKSEDQK